MKKTIYLDPDEEIVSIVDKLTQTQAEEIDLVVSDDAQIWQSLINLKLLRREADYLGKDVSLVTTDDKAIEMAARVGFPVRKEVDFSGETDEEENLEGLKPEELKEKNEFRELEKDRESIKDKTEGERENDFWTEPLPEEELPSPIEPSIMGEEGPDKGFFSTLANLSFNRKKKKRLTDIVEQDEKNKIDFFKISLRKKIFNKKEDKPDLPEKPNFPRQVEELKQTKEPQWSKFFVIFISLAVVAAFAVAYLVLPTSEIVIFPNAELMEFNVLVVGSKDIIEVDASLNKIPLQEIKVTESEIEEFSASGEKEVEEKARGIITVYNEYSSSPQILVATTRFESSEGKVFRIKENVTVPGAEIEEGKIVASFFDVEVTADQPGKEYNIGLSDFTIPGFKGTPKYASFYAKSKTKMEGGSTGKVKIVTADDLKKAREKIEEKLEKNLDRTFEKQLPVSLKLVEGGVKKEIAELSDIKEDAQTDKFTLEMTASVQALLFNEEDIKKLADLNLISMIQENKKPLSQTQEIEIGKPIIDWEEGKISFYLYVKEDAVLDIDERSLKADLAGLTEVEVRKYLANRPEIKRAKVSFKPFWVKRIPPQENKIKIKIEN